MRKPSARCHPLGIFPSERLWLPSAVRIRGDESFRDSSLIPRELRNETSATRQSCWTRYGHASPSQARHEPESRWSKVHTDRIVSPKHEGEEDMDCCRLRYHESLTRPERSAPTMPWKPPKSAFVSTIAESDRGTFSWFPKRVFTT